MTLLCLTCGVEIEAEPTTVFGELIATCPRSDGEGVPPCDLLQVARLAPPPPDPKEA